MYQYIVKDMYGRYASVDNDPILGGTYGVEMFRGSETDDIRGTPLARELGTAIVLVEGGSNAHVIMSKLEGRPLIREDGRWELRDHSELYLPWYGIENSSCSTTSSVMY